MKLSVSSNEKLWFAGILTKPDLVDKGTEDKIVDVVRNLVCHLKKGYMIVKCRGQQDIQDKMSLANALCKEKAFFEAHPQYRYGSLRLPQVPPRRRASVLPRGNHRFPNVGNWGVQVSVFVP